MFLMNRDILCRVVNGIGGKPVTSLFGGEVGWGGRGGNVKCHHDGCVG